MNITGKISGNAVCALSSRRRSRGLFRACLRRIDRSRSALRRLLRSRLLRWCLRRTCLRRGCLRRGWWLRCHDACRGNFSQSRRRHHDSIRYRVGCLSALGKARGGGCEKYANHDGCERNYPSDNPDTGASNRGALARIVVPQHILLEGALRGERRKLCGRRVVALMFLGVDHALPPSSALFVSALVLVRISEEVSSARLADRRAFPQCRVRVR